MFSSDVETEAGEKAAKEEAVVENTTPDYAAGLVSAQVLCFHVCLPPSLAAFTAPCVVLLFRNWGR